MRYRYRYFYTVLFFLLFHTLNFNEIEMFCTVNERNVHGVNKCFNWTLNQLEIIKLILSRLYSKKMIG